MVEEYLSVRITQSPDTVELDMTRYIEDITHEMFPGGVHGKYEVPMRQELPDMTRRALAAKDTSYRNTEGGTRYTRIVQVLLYASTMVIAELAATICILSTCNAYPNDDLLREAERALIYTYHRRHLRLTYHKTGMPVNISSDFAPTIGPTIDPHVDGDTDANLEVDRSISASAFYIQAVTGRRSPNGAISWAAKKQNVTALYSTEAEFYALSLGCCEAVSLRALVGIDLGFPQDQPTVVRCDNSGALSLAHDAVQHSKAKHIHRRHFHIRDLVAGGIVKLCWVKSSDNRADCMTKPLPRIPFQKGRAALLGLA